MLLSLPDLLDAVVVEVVIFHMACCWRCCPRPPWYWCYCPDSLYCRCSHLSCCFPRVSYCWLYCPAYMLSRGVWGINTRPDWGGGAVQYPLRFVEGSEKNCRAQRHRFMHTSCAIFCLFPENFVSRSSQVRSPGQVKRPYLLRSLWCYSSYSLWAITLKLSGYHKIMSGYKTHISSFFISVT